MEIYQTYQMTHVYIYIYIVYKEDAIFTRYDISIFYNNIFIIIYMEY